MKFQTHRTLSFPANLFMPLRSLGRLRCCLKTNLFHILDVSALRVSHFTLPLPIVCGKHLSPHLQLKPISAGRPDLSSYLCLGELHLRNSSPSHSCRFECWVPLLSPSRNSSWRPCLQPHATAYSSLSGFCFTLHAPTYLFPLSQ